MSLLTDRRERLLNVLAQQVEWATATTLFESLPQNGVEKRKSLKTLNRDLDTLEAHGQVNRKDQGPGLATLWQISKYHHPTNLLRTDAMTLVALFDHADRFGLNTQTTQLAALRDFATRVVNGKRPGATPLSSRITTGTRFMVLRPGRHDPEFLPRIQEAIWHGEPLSVTYRPRDADDALCVYQLKPLALSYQDSNTYLSAWVAEEHWLDGYQPDPNKLRGKYSSNGPDSLCALMLHRIVAIDTGRVNIPDPEGYDVHPVEARRHLMTLHDDTPVRLELRLSPNLYNRLQENPLTDDQTLEPAADGHWALTCDLHDSQGLRLFLLSNAADIEVIQPASLREYVRDTLRKALALYEVPQKPEKRQDP